MKNKTKSFISLMLVFALWVASLPMVAVAENHYLTRGEAAALLCDAADFYNKGVQKSDIMIGDGSDLRENDPVTELEAYVMASRAFGRLDKPEGHNARITETDFTYSDIPQWAASDIANLIQGGVMVSSKDGQLSPKATLTADELDTFIHRFYLLKGENLKDDFYSTVNKRLLDELQIYPGNTMGNTYAEIDYQTEQILDQMLQDILVQQHAKGTAGQQISDYYASIMDVTARNEAGIQPIQPYLTAIDSIQSVDDFIAVRHQVLEELGYRLLIDFGIITGFDDATKYELILGLPAAFLSKDEYLDESSDRVQGFYQYAEELLVIGGEDAASARQKMHRLLEIHKRWAAVGHSPEDRYNPDKMNNPYTFAELQEYFPDIDLKAMLLADGWGEVETVIVADPAQMKECAKNLQNIEDIKLLAKIDLLRTTSKTLSMDLIEAANRANSRMFGQDMSKPLSAMASDVVRSDMSGALGQMFIEQHFSPQAKAEVESLVREYIEAYKLRLQANTWMSAQTRERALKKLETMRYDVAYPDTWDSLMESVEILNPAEGGSYFANTCAIVRAEFAAGQKKQFQQTAIDWSDCPVYMVNAFYDAQTNSIFLPAGVLQAPSYDINASREENLAGIGVTIGHELSHSFDNHGALYDENGNHANWWTDEDFQRFEALCEKVVTFYDGQEIAPGIPLNGRLTLGENVADLGGISCTMDLLNKMENPDYDKFYRACVGSFVDTATRNAYKIFTQTDVHAMASPRQNRMIQSVDHFFEFYDIQPGDGMYVAPEERARVW